MALAPVPVSRSSGPTGATINPQTGELDWLPSASGSFPFEIEATDPQNLSGTQSWTVNVTGMPTNHPPVVNTQTPLPIAQASVGRLYEAMVDRNFTDPDGDTLHFSTVGTWPAGMTLSDTGDIEWTPTADEITGTGANPYHLQVQASDDRGGTATLTFPISVAYYAPDAPYAVSATDNGDGTATVIWANSPDTDILGYNVYRSNSTGGSPVLLNTSGLVSRTNDYLPSWTDEYPSEPTTQTYSYDVTTVSDTDGHLLESVPSNSFNVTVQGTLVGQVTISHAAQAIVDPNTDGTTANLSVSASDSNPSAILTYDWTIVGTPPAPVSFAPTQPSGSSSAVATFTAPGTYTFLVSVSDGSQTVTSTATCTVLDIVGQLVITPAATDTSPLEIGENQQQQFTAIATDQFGNAMTLPATVSWSLVDSSAADSHIDQASGLFTAGADAGTALVQAMDSVSGAYAQVPVTVSQPAPTIVDPASASPATVTGTTTQLSVLGQEGTDDSGLTYTWSTTGTPPAAVTFSDNGDNSAKNTTATFASAGTYTFVVTVANADNVSTTSQVQVDVEQVETSIAVTPGTALVPVSTADQTSTQQFTAQALDQFGNPMAAAGSFAWSDSSGSPIDSTGLYTAPTTGSTDNVTATADGARGNATVGLIGSEDDAVIATGESSSDITVSWNSVQNAVYYNVYRSTEPNFDPSEGNLVESGESATAFNDFSATAGTAYYYQVYATTQTTSGEAREFLGAAMASDEPTLPPGAQPQITSLQAVGVNDLEILLHWTINVDPQYDASPTIIEESTTPANSASWVDVGWAAVGESYYIVRGCGLNGAQFLQENTDYYFRAEQTNSSSSTATSGTSNPANVLAPNFDVDLGNDMVIVCGPHTKTASDLLSGITLNPSGIGPPLAGQEASDSVGMIWVDLVDKGYNAYIVPDPADGGSFAPGQASGTSYYSLPDGGQLESTLNIDGSGRLSEEINYEASQANGASSLFGLGSGLDLSFIGYSWGGGMVANISNYLLNTGQTAGISENVYVATIDAIAYGTVQPYTRSPAILWNGYGHNYLETNGDGWYPSLTGASMPGVPDNQYGIGNPGYGHSAIGVDLTVLSAVENDLISFYDMLPGY